MRSRNCVFWYLLLETTEYSYLLYYFKADRSFVPPGLKFAKVTVPFERSILPVPCFFFLSHTTY